MVSKSEKLHTSYSVLLSQKGDRSILTYHGAVGEFTLKNVNPKILKSKWWYVSLSGDSYKVLDGVLKYAQKHTPGKVGCKGLFIIPVISENDTFLGH